MSQNFVEGVRLSSLTEGGGLALWSFRACAVGATRCQCFPQTFDCHFGAAGPDVLHHIMVMAQLVGQYGARKITLSYPNSNRLTHDETSLLNTLSAAQHTNEAGLCAHITWIMAGGETTKLAKAVCYVASAFAEQGLFIERIGSKRHIRNKNA